MGYEMTDQGWNRIITDLFIERCDQEVLDKHLFGTGFNGAMNEDEFRYLSKNSYCISNYDEVVFQGSLQALKARFVNVILKKCTGKPTCKSEAELERFLEDHRVWISYNE